MSETATIVKLIAALRDTAEKVAEMQTVRVQTDRMWKGGEYVEGYDSTTEKYSRDWIAGRLLGMADTLEAMTAAPVRREPAPPLDLSGLTGEAQ